MSAPLPFRLGPVSGRLERHYVIASGLLLVVGFAVAYIGLMMGAITFSAGDVLDALTGHGNGLTDLFVMKWRLPRALCALIFGAMLGVAGAMFQIVTRNPLGSPDVIGFTTGSHTGGILVILLIGNGFAGVAAGSIIGGLLTAVVVFALSRSGAAQGYRLVLVGIGLTSMLASVDTFLLLTADSDNAMLAAVWGVGSLNGMTFTYATPALVAGVVLIVAALAFSSRLRQLEFGDDVATALGVNPGRTRLLAILLGITLVALTTAVAGPISFVALAAPHIGRRMVRADGTPLLPAALAGGVVLVVSDLLAQHGVPGTTFPVGVVTVTVGGLYLLSLLVAEDRKGSL